MPTLPALFTLGAVDVSSEKNLSNDKLPFTPQNEICDICLMEVCGEKLLKAQPLNQRIRWERLQQRRLSQTLLLREVE